MQEQTNSKLAEFVLDIFSSDNKNNFFKIVLNSIENNKKSNNKLDNKEVKQETTKETSSNNNNPVDNTNVKKEESKSSSSTMADINDFNDPLKLYKANIEEIKTTKGEKYATFNCYEDGKIDLKLKNNIEKYEEDMLVFFKVSRLHQISIRKRISQKDLDDENTFNVISVEDDVAILSGDNLTLDLSEDYFNTSKEEYKIKAYKCFYVETLISKGIYKFDSVEELPKENISLIADDKIIVDSENKILVVFHII